MAFITTPLGPAVPNIPAIQGWVSSATIAFGGGQPIPVANALVQLQVLVPPLDGGKKMARDLRKLIGGQNLPDSSRFDSVLTRISTAVEQYKQRAAGEIARLGGSGLLTKKTRPAYAARATHKGYIPRPDQKDIAKACVQHYTKPNKYGEMQKRGVFREDTGLGKSLQYAFNIEALMKADAKFKKMRYIILSNRIEPTRDIRDQVAAVFPKSQVSMVDGKTDLDEIKDAQFVVLTYSQCAEKKTVQLLKKWAGEETVFFVNDETDLTVYKGEKVDKEGRPVKGWQSNWFRPLIEFGLFPRGGKYTPESPHYLMGASATLDRPDKIPLSTVYGPGNCFDHKPMTWAMKKKLLVTTIGEVIDMRIPGDAYENFLEFFIERPDGSLVLDEKKIAAYQRSDRAVKTCVRAYVDRMIMEIGVGANKGKAIAKGIGYAEDREMLEKHMRWQQDIFRLMESIFSIHQGFGHKEEKHKITAPAIVRHMETHVAPYLAEKRRRLRKKSSEATREEIIDAFGEDLERFLYEDEWKLIKPTWERASRALKRGDKDQAQHLFDWLYKKFNVEARRIKGKPLVASALWQKMDQNQNTGEKIKVRPPVSTEAAARLYPNKHWPNGFGDRAVSMQAMKDGEIDMAWSIDFFERAFNAPIRSVIIDNRRIKKSRRRVQQQAGRIERPPDGRNPTDHSLKPLSRYVTVTPNLYVHKVDLSRTDFAKAYGLQLDPELMTVRVAPDTVDTIGPWRTEDEVQFDFGGGRVVNLVSFGIRTARAVEAFLEVKYGKKFDASIAAYDAGLNSDEAEGLFAFLITAGWVKQEKLRRWLKAWGADDAATRKIMTTHQSEVAEMQVVYGPYFAIVQRGRVQPS